MHTETTHLSATITELSALGAMDGMTVQLESETGLEHLPPDVADAVTAAANDRTTRHWYTTTSATHTLNLAMPYRAPDGTPHVAIVTHTATRLETVTGTSAIRLEPAELPDWDQAGSPASRPATPLAAAAVMWTALGPAELFERIADQLHDGTMQTLSAALMHLSVIMRTMDTTSAFGYQIREAHALVRQSGDTLRHTVDLLRKGFKTVTSEQQTG